MYNPSTQEQQPPLTRFAGGISSSSGQYRYNVFVRSRVLYSALLHRECVITHNKYHFVNLRTTTMVATGMRRRQPAGQLADGPP